MKFVGKTRLGAILPLQWDRMANKSYKQQIRDKNYLLGKTIILDNGLMLIRRTKCVIEVI